MIVLGTNVVSEAMKPQPDATVMAWLDSRPTETLYLTSITMAELLFGIAVLADGDRKKRLARAVDGVFGYFDGRVLAFDTESAHCYASLALTARQGGRGFPTPDGYIAAIAARHGCIVASRDTAPFEAARLEYVNPWLWQG